MPSYRVSYEWTCRYCGRFWDSLGSDGIGHRTGFVKKAAAQHIYSCERRTPAQRRACNAAAERAWAKRPPCAIVRNDPQHPGLKDS